MRQPTGTMKDYQATLREHLSKYRISVLGVDEQGIWKRNRRSYPHILPAEMQRLNILESYRDEFWQSKSASVSLHQGFHHLNSSQAMTFNLFLPLILDGAFDQQRFLTILGIAEETIVEIAFEKVLDFKEQTNIDFFVRLSSYKLLFELKLSEQGFGASPQNPRRLVKLEQVYAPALTGMVDAEYLKPPGFFRHYQIYRNLYYLTDPRDRLYLVFPQANNRLADAWLRVEETLTQRAREQVHVVYLEDIATELLEAASSVSSRQHYQEFKLKYMC